MRRSLLLTLHYADIFDFPLEPSEIQRYLLFRRASLAEVEEGLASLLAEGLVERQSGYYFLPGKSWVVAQRLKRQGEVEARRRLARRVAFFIGLLPWVKLVGLTGALAVGNSSLDDDLDLFVVTSPRRVWLVRGLVVSFLILLRLYRRPVCPNMWLSRGILSFQKDVYVAHELRQLVPLVSKEGCYEELLKRNPWVSEFLPNFPEVGGSFREEPRGRRSFVGLAKVLDFLEAWAYRWQKFYMQRKITSETVEEEKAFFHSRDARAFVLSEFARRVKGLEEKS